MCTKKWVWFQTGKAKSKTILELQTKKLDLLPVVDFLPIDYGKSGQAFGFQMGPVCFR